MSPLPTETFARRFRRLSADDRRAFLAALWEGRGYETTVEDGLVIATADGRETRIDVRGWISPGETTADVVVGTRNAERISASADRSGAEFLSPSDLLTLLAYGLERDVGERLAAAHLGMDLTVRHTPEGDGDGKAQAWARYGAVALALLVAIGAILAISGVGLSILDGGTSTGEFPDPDSVAQDTDVAGGDPSDEDGSSEETERTDGYPAGLNGSGVTNATALVDTHRALVDGRQRTVTLSYASPPNESMFLGATRHEAVASIHSKGRFLFTAEEYANTSQTEPGLVVKNWGDGERSHLLFTGADRTRDYSIRPLGNDPGNLIHSYESFVIDRYERAMATNESSVETVSASGVTLLVVTATGHPDGYPAEATDFRAIAQLTPEGRLVRLTVTYTDRPTGGDVRLVVTYRALDDVPPPPEPDWVSEEREESDGSGESGESDGSDGSGESD